MALIGLAILVIFISKESASQVTLLGSLERLNNLDSSIQKSLRDIFYANANIKISGNKTQVVFTENISNSQFFSYNISLFNLTTHIRSEFPNIPIYFNLTNGILDAPRELHLMILPNLIDYHHDFANKKIKILPQALNVNGYHFIINITNPAVSTVNCEGTITPGNFYFRIEAYSPDGINSCEKLHSIDPKKTSTIDIVSSPNPKVSINIDNPAFVTITNNDVYNITVTSEIILNNTFNKGSIKVTQNSYTIDFISEFGLYSSQGTLLQKYRTSLGLYKTRTVTLYNKLINSETVLDEVDEGDK